MQINSPVVTDRNTKNGECKESLFDGSDIGADTSDKPFGCLSIAKEC